MFRHSYRQRFSTCIFCHFYFSFLRIFFRSLLLLLCQTERVAGAGSTWIGKCAVVVVVVVVVDYLTGTFSPTRIALAVLVARSARTCKSFHSALGGGGGGAVGADDNDADDDGHPCRKGANKKNPNKVVSIVLRGTSTRSYSCHVLLSHCALSALTAHSLTHTPGQPPNFESLQLDFSLSMLLASHHWLNHLVDDLNRTEG